MSANIVVFNNKAQTTSLVLKKLGGQRGATLLTLESSLHVFHKHVKQEEGDDRDKEEAAAKEKEGAKAKEKQNERNEHGKAGEEPNSETLVSIGGRGQRRRGGRVPRERARDRQRETRAERDV